MVSKNPKNFEFKLGKQGFLLFVAGMSFLLLGAFIIGVMVGTHIDAYPEKIAQSVPAIIRRHLSHPAVIAEKVAAVREETKALPVSEDNNVVAPLPDPFVAKDDLPVATTGAEKKTRPTAPADTGTAGKHQPAQADAGAAVPSPPLPEAGGKYSVQVASLKSLKTAEQLSNKITPLGFKPRVAMVDLPNKGRWFRVVVDGFTSHDEAQQAAVLLAKNIKGISGIVRPGK